ncbi:ACP S-malonyltransferase [Corallococcus llansteffanensis]|uniref:Malonyl CoA-acyl carrier protein transacylase n=1 Tax=Corallococcus llansteffanensis TaxID=2316731 RepID=A0A3A8QIV5_9BACT|nr:ACP S-malonyltransferase [Corallococcus llansteffanensis]RKH68636.1 [acyl-carrier-protein] S-malonyltransferase [Corallococcus llansteffanensis]
MHKVYVFPGQGAQKLGMGQGLFERFPAYTRAADSILGYSIQRLCLTDEANQLRRTEYTQPALYVVCALMYLDRARTDSTDPAFFIGHSLGEYVALFAAGVFDFETGLKLVKRRGELMGRATGGGMAAVMGCDRATVESTLRRAGLTSLDLANLNAPRQMVLSGPLDDISRAAPLFEAQQARFVPLNVSAPFHSRYMRAAADEFARELGHVHLRTLRVPVMANASSRPHQHESLREMLARQIESPVNWVDSIEFIMAQGDFTFEELGPTSVLTRLVKEIREAAAPAPRAAPSREATC